MTFEKLQRKVSEGKVWVVQMNQREQRERVRVRTIREKGNGEYFIFTRLSPAVVTRDKLEIK